MPVFNDDADKLITPFEREIDDMGVSVSRCVKALVDSACGSGFMSFVRADPRTQDRRQGHGDEAGDENRDR